MADDKIATTSVAPEREPSGTQNRCRRKHPRQKRQKLTGIYLRRPSRRHTMVDRRARARLATSLARDRGNERRPPASRRHVARSRGMDPSWVGPTPSSLIPPDSGCDRPRFARLAVTSDRVDRSVSPAPNHLKMTRPAAGGHQRPTLPQSIPRPETRDLSESVTSGARANADRQTNKGASLTDSKTSSGKSREAEGIPVAPFGYGLLGAGVVMVINRLRRAQQRHRPSGMRIVLPDKDLAGAEQILRSSADHEAAAWVDAALRTLAAACRSKERRAPRVVAVRVLDSATEPIVGAALDSEPCAPFERHDHKSSWFLPRQPDLLDDAPADPWVAGMDVMSPGLVTLGRGPQGLLLVDVEQAGSIAVLGEDADDVLRAMAIELATSSWSEQVNVVLVGMERVSHGRQSSDPTLDVLDRVREASDLVEVLPELRHVTTERSIMLGAVGLDRTSDARLAVSGDGWDLTVVFCSSRAVAANRKALAELVGLAGDGSHGLATVCTGSIEGANWLVEAGHGPVTFRLAGVPEATVWPQTLDDDAGEQIAKLVDVARHLDGVDVDSALRRNRNALCGLQLADDDPPPDGRDSRSGACPGGWRSEAFYSSVVARACGVSGDAPRGRDR